jgi:hypothetical protein
VCREVYRDQYSMKAERRAKSGKYACKRLYLVVILLLLCVPNLTYCLVIIS